MVDYVLPANPPPSDVEWRILDNTAADAPGPWGGMQTVTRPGARWACRISWQNLNAANRHKLMALVASLRGRANRLWVNDITATLRGSMSAPELFANADFSQGTSGWSSNSATLTASNGVLRATRVKGSTSAVEILRGASLTQYAPFALRSLVTAPQWIPANFIGAAIYDGVQQVNDYPTERRLLTASFVSLASGSISNYPVVAAADAVAPGAYVDLHFSSMARCILADSGANALLQSDVFGTTWVPGGQAGVVSNTVAAPDGTSTADTLEETGTGNAEHYVGQSFACTSAVQDITFSISLKSGTRAFASVAIIEGTGGGSAYVFVNLSTGAVGTLIAGTNWTNGRAHVVSQGDGWWRVTITARKTNAATSLTAYAGSATADGAFTYAGTVGFSAIYLFRGCASVGSVPSRGSQTTTTSNSGAAQTGSAIYVKGLPASTSGALVAGDPVEIRAGTRSHFARLVADLDSDAAGLGYMQIEPPCPWQIADNAPVIVQKPMVRMMLADGDVAWPTRPGMFSDFSIDLVQDPT